MKDMKDIKNHVKIIRPTLKSWEQVYVQVPLTFSSESKKSNYYLAATFVFFFKLSFALVKDESQ